MAEKTEVELMEGYEKYLSGKPLNEELAAVREGQVHLSNARAMERKAKPVDEKGSDPQAHWQPSRTQLVDIRELKQSDGWPVLMLLLRKRFQTHEKNAITASQIDPLKNKDVIAENWAYAMMYKRALADMEAVVEDELQRLRELEAGPRIPVPNG